MPPRKRELGVSGRIRRVGGRVLWGSIDRVRGGDVAVDRSATEAPDEGVDQKMGTRHTQ